MIRYFRLPLFKKFKIFNKLVLHVVRVLFENNRGRMGGVTKLIEN